METHADCLRQLAGALDAGGRELEVGAQLLGIAAKLRGGTDDEAERQVVPPLVVIENPSKLGVSAKYEMPALNALAPADFERFVKAMCGIVSQVAAERTKG